MRVRGFTLVELMVVVVIIGVLAAIVIPVIGGAQNEAMFAVARDLGSALDRGLNMYVVRKGKAPSSFMSFVSVDRTSSNQSFVFLDRIRPNLHESMGQIMDENTTMELTFRNGLVATYEISGARVVASYSGPGSE